MDDVVRYDASFDEYWETLEDCEYKVEYVNGQIVSIMSYASDKHELLVSSMIYLLGNLFYEKPDHFVYASNRPILIPDRAGVFQPDASIIVGSPQFFQYDKGKNANVNPALIIEILSKSTRDFDWDEKLPNYKLIPSVKQILYIDSLKKKVSSFQRLDTGNQWLNIDFFEDEDAIPVLDKAILLKTIYQKLIFA